MALFKEVADIQTADMLNLPVPKAKYETVVCKPSDIQKEMVEALGQRADAVRSGAVDASQDNMLLITNDGRKLALDQRLLNPLLPDMEGSKVNVCAEKVYQIWKDTQKDKLTQLVFCDLSTPKTDGFFSVYNELKDKLVARGIPQEEIAFVHSAANETQKQQLFGRVRAGQVRVLMGSTAKMGAGTNVQDMYTDAPDQVLRLSLEGAEFALKISGVAAKNIAAALYAVLKDQKRTKGKARITTMLRQQRPMTIYTIKKEDCPAFAKQARGYGVLYAPIPVKKGDDTVDVMVFQDDAVRVNRIVERLELTVLDTASIENGIQQSREDKAPFPGRTERSSPSGNTSRQDGPFSRSFSEKPSVRQELKKLQNERTFKGNRARKHPERDAR